MGTRFFRHWRVVSSISAAGVQPQVHKPPGQLIRLGHLLGLDLALQEVQQVLVGRLGHDLVLRLGLVLVLVLLEVLVVLEVQQELGQEQLEDLVADVLSDLSRWQGSCSRHPEWSPQRAARHGAAGIWRAPSLCDVPQRARGPKLFRHSPRHPSGTHVPREQQAPGCK
jgi:hypothetical protein